MAGPRVLEYWGSVTDISQLQQSHTDLAQAKARSDAVGKDLARSNLDLEQFAYVASHDLQEPLRMVSGFVEMLRKRLHNLGPLDEKSEEFMGFILEGSLRMQDLIRDLLAYSRVNRRGEQLAPMPLGASLDQAMANLRLAIADSGAHVQADGLPVVLGDPLQLSLLLQNLLGNAIKFRRPDAPPEIRITARRADEHWVIAVQDNGIGIEPQFFHRIFMIFQRLHTRDAYPGTGIGLSVCKKIIERHGGRIWVESQPGEGATFFFTLIPADEQVPADARE